MNAVEIEEAVSVLAEEPFDPGEFPFDFLEAFGNKPTTIKRLRAGTTNRTDVGGVLQRSNIHIKVAPEGEAAAALADLKASPETARAKAKFVLATDGREFHAEDVESGDIVVCEYPDFHEHFGFFLPLAGITTVKQIRESAFDIKATGRLNRLYVELLNENPGWGAVGRRRDMNHFMARLIFCFFAEDTEIFPDKAPFTGTIEQMSTPDGSNTHEVIDEVFRAMNTSMEERRTANLSRWAQVFPYVNGGLFSDSTDVPRFSRIARSYLLHIGNLDWKKINPDIFGSMIQAVADDEERDALGMHYTSVPNILKVLNPLFLDDLRERLEEAGDNNRKLLNLRNRIARIRVFDPACGSGNFLVIAYKEMRAIEAKINKRRRESWRRSDIPLTNFRGIEIRDFPAEVARLALIIAEYQCDVRYLGQKEAVAVVLPLNKENWITCANALRLDWSGLCPPTGIGVKHVADDLFQTPLDQPEIDFENEGGETYLCGNPPYRGSTWQSKKQKADLKQVFTGRVQQWRSLDYVAGWFMKAAEYMGTTRAASAFVTTNSLNQGQQAAILWPAIFATGQEIAFAHTSFKWANLASHNAGVTVSVVGMSNEAGRVRRLYSTDKGGKTIQRDTGSINAYLVAGPNVIVKRASKPLTGLVRHEQEAIKPTWTRGNLLLTQRRGGGSRPLPGAGGPLHPALLRLKGVHSRGIALLPLDRGQGPGRGAGHPGNPRAGRGRAHNAAREPRQGRESDGEPVAPVSRNEHRDQIHNHRSPRLVGASRLPARRIHASRHDHRRPKLRALRCSALEHGADRLAPPSDLDRYRLCSDADRFFVFQHPRLAHLPRADAHREEQGGPDHLRRAHPAGEGSALPGHDRRSLRFRLHAGEPPCRPRPE